LMSPSNKECRFRKSLSFKVITRDRKCGVLTITTSPKIIFGLFEHSDT